MASAGHPRAFGSDSPIGSGRVGLGGRYRQTHNKDEDLRNCTFVATFINFVAKNMTKGRHLRHDKNVATKPRQSQKLKKETSMSRHRPTM